MTQPSTAQVLLLEDGTGTLTIDGRSRRVDAVDVASARDELSDQLRRHAVRAHVTVRAHLTDPTGDWLLDVAATGAITTSPVAEDDTRPLGDSLAHREDTDLAAELFGRDQQPVNASPLRKRHWPTPGHRTAALAAGLTLALGGAAATTWWVQREEEPRTVSVQPVQGWTRQIAWQSPPLAESIHHRTPVLPVDGALITAIDTDEGESLTAIDPSTGESLWVSPLEEPLTGPPQMIGPDQKAVAAATAHTLTIWTDPTKAASSSQTWSFTEADVLPVHGSPVPLLTNTQTSTALTVHDGKLLRRTIPRGTRPVAADSHGRVIAVSGDGHWWGLTDTAGSPHMLQPPAFGATVRTVLGMSRQTLVVSWTRDENDSFLVGYAIEDGMSPSWRTEVTGKPTSSAFDVSPDGSWFIAGTTAVDAATGRTRGLPDDWATVGMTNDAAWSKRHVAKKLQPAVVLSKPLDDITSVPVATTEDERGAFVADNGQEARLYRLERAGVTPYGTREPDRRETK